MFKDLPLPKTPPASAEEAVATARNLLQAIGLNDTTVTLKTQATVPGGLTGASLSAEVPVASMEALAHKTALEAAAEHGVNITKTALTVEQAGESRLHLRVRVEARIFGGTIPIEVEGYLEAQNGSHLRFSALHLEGGGGMMAGVAAAMIRPKLAQLEATPMPLIELTGVPLEITRLSSTQGVMIVDATFQ